MSGDVFAASAIIIAVSTKRKREKRKRAEWVKPWLVRRPQLGAYDTLLSELQMEEESEYKNYLRMSPECFDEVLFDFVKNVNSTFLVLFTEEQKRYIQFNQTSK